MPCELGPGFPAIVGTVETAAGATDGRVGAPGRAMSLPHGGHQNVGCVGGDGQISSADAWTFTQNMGPGGTAIGGLVHASFVIGTVRMAQSGDIDDLRVIRVNDNAADLPRLLKSDVLPRFASIQGLVDT